MNTLVAAAYLRKSPDSSEADKGDDAKSISRQLARCREYAALKGWSFSEAHIYTDDQISGAEFVKRPGFIRLLNALTPRPPFQVLIMSEESRLGREQIKTAYALQQIIEAGVRVFFYLEDRERKLETAMDKVTLALSGFASEVEREKASQRTTDALRLRAAAGFVTSGRCYGYDHIRSKKPEAGDEAKKSFVDLQINKPEAKIVCRIFQLTADGRGCRAIATQLNADGIPGPTTKKGSSGVWEASAIRAMLFRDLYQGRVVYGKTRWQDRGRTAAGPRRRWTPRRAHGS